MYIVHMYMYVFQSLSPLDELVIGVRVDAAIAQPARSLGSELEAEGIVVGLQPWRHPILPLSA